MGFLICWSVYLALSIVLDILHLISNGDGLFSNIVAGVVSVVTFALIIFLIWAGVAISIKRFHDRDKAGWWVFLALIPVVGAVWLFVELGLLPGTPGTNRYG